MKKFYLIDVSGFIYRAYHALPPLRRQDGTPVGAVYGFCNMLWRLIEDCHNDGNIDLIAAVFDSGRKTFRNEIYPDYKSHRPPPPDDLIPQFPLFREACQAFDVVSIEQEGFEADDIIATYAKTGIEAGYSVVIVSADKDLMQLVRPGITLLDPLKNRQIDIPEVTEKFGVPPDKVIDVQALAGDSSDNVPGVPGIGVKTAAELIQTYGDLETLLSRASEIKQPKRREILLANIENARLSKRLVTLREDAALPHALEDLRLRVYNPVTLRDFLNRQNFHSLITRLDRIRVSDQGTTYETVTTKEELERWISMALKTSVIAIDCETTSLTIEQADLVGISLAIAPQKACYIPLGHATTTQQLPLREVLLDLMPLLRDPAILKVGHNLKYDKRVLQKYGLTIEPYADTMLMSYALYAGLHSHGLDELSLRYLNHTNISYMEVTDRGKKLFSEVDLATATAYAAEDADMALRLYELFKNALPKAQVSYVYEYLERPLIPIIADMEQTGVTIDQKVLKDLKVEFEHGLETIARQIWESAGHPFNIASPKQLGIVLFEELKLPVSKKTKTGSYTTDADTLEQLAAQGFPVVQQVLEWRALAKLNSTYVEGLLAAICPHTGRVHTSYSLAGTATGRLSSSDPNLQNIPIRTANGRKIRSAFIASPGYQLLCLDYSQIELRLLAHIAQVKPLIQAFHQGKDIHALTASHIFDVPLSAVNSDMRRKAKTINFGINYGISAYGLSQQLGISQSEAASYIKAYFSYYPGIQTYMEQAKDFARKHGFVTTLFGRRCHIVGLQESNAIARQFAERQAINAPLQGTNADIIKKAMNHIPEVLQKHRLQARLLLQVHDELVFEVPEGEINPTQGILKDLMESVVALRVPLVVTAKVGRNWGEVD